MSIAARAVHGLKVCVIPDPYNDFRPLALRHRPLAAVTALLLIVKLVAASAIALIPAPAELSTITSAKIVELTNVERAKRGAGKLKVNSLLASAAQQKAQHMLDKDYFAHISPDGVTPWFWMAKVGYKYEMAGENLAIDFLEAEDVVAAWLASPSHRDNMLQAAYTDIGVAAISGEFQGGTSIVVAQMFGRSAGQAAAETTQAPPAKPVATPAPTQPPATAAPATPPPLPPADQSPPRVPRIALSGGTVVKATVYVTIEAEPASTVHLLVNNQARHALRVPENGQVSQQLDLSEFPEGTIVLRAYARDAAGNESEMSELLALTKDTVGPLIDDKALAFVISPGFDTPRLAVHLPGSDFSIQGQREGWVAAGAVTELVTITLEDEFGNETKLASLNFTPQFVSDPQSEEVTLPSRAQQFSRRLASAIAAVLVVLLILTILIQVRIQRPALIAHTLVVIALAVTLFLI
ncbi:MAG: CAP domain-containing protein [Patescibacteria group bacterium]